VIWRKSYQTLIKGPCRVPQLSFEGRAALLAAPTADGFRELEVWRRLCEAELPIPYWLGAIEFDALHLISPPSRHDRLIRLGEEWVGVAGDAPCLALIGQGNEAEVLMLGSPTEDAWAEFLRIST